MQRWSESPGCLQLTGQEALLCLCHCSFSGSSLHEVIFTQPLQLTRSPGLGRKADNAECSQPRALGEAAAKQGEKYFPLWLGHREGTRGTCSSECPSASTGHRQGWS